MSTDTIRETVTAAVHELVADGATPVEIACAAIAAHLSALEAEGYVVVPADPTDAMRHAGMLARDAQSQRRANPLTQGEEAVDTWRAMVASIRAGA